MDVCTFPAGEPGTAWHGETPASCQLQLCACLVPRSEPCQTPSATPGLLQHPRGKEGIGKEGEKEGEVADGPWHRLVGFPRALVCAEAARALCGCWDSKMSLTRLGLPQRVHLQGSRWRRTLAQHHAPRCSCSAEGRPRCAPCPSVTCQALREGWACAGGRKEGGLSVLTADTFCLEGRSRRGAYPRDSVRFHLMRKDVLGRLSEVSRRVLKHHFSLGAGDSLPPGGAAPGLLTNRALRRPCP